MADFSVVPEMTAEIDPDDDIEGDIEIHQGGAVVATVLGSDQFACFDGDAVLFRDEQVSLARLFAASPNCSRRARRWLATRWRRSSWLAPPSARRRGAEVDRNELHPVYRDWLVVVGYVVVMSYALLGFLAAAGQLN